MPYCTNCGRPLNAGETCNCKDGTGSTAVQNQQTAPQQPQAQIPPMNSGNIQIPQSPPYPPYPPYPQQYAPNGYPQGYPPPYYGQPAPQNKKSYLWVLAIVIPLGLLLLLIMGIVLIPPMLGYTKRSAQSSMNSKASALYKAANTALIELDEEDVKIKGTYIICSDYDDNVAVPFTLDKFYDKAERYFSDMDKYEYFMVVRNGTVVYTAISKSWTNTKETVGTYPSDASYPVFYSEYSPKERIKDKDDLDTMYWDAYDKIFNK